MRSLSILLVLALLGAEVPAAPQAPVPEPAGPPFWEARPFEQWTATETVALLTNSPWSQVATVVEPGVEVHPGRMQYFVQWYSAQTLREALVRMRHLQGRVDPVADARFLETPRNAYQLYLFAGFFTDSRELRTVPLEAFEEVTADDLYNGVRLAFSAQEHASRPDRVEMFRLAEGQPLVAIRLTFERARVAVPPEQARGGQVQLICPTKAGSLSVTFLLNDMRRQGQPDL